jgi:cAMP phosphodiesterase
MATTPDQHDMIRDVVITHAHLDHIAGLPLFIDDNFSTLTEPITVYATQEVIDILERDIFNWDVYPRFSELSNANGPVMRYEPFGRAEEFTARHLTLRPVDVNHKVPSSGFLISDATTTIALSGDTAETDGFWNLVNSAERLSAILIECAFPDELDELAVVSHHLTPRRMREELVKCERTCPVYVVNLKPAFRDAIEAQLAELDLTGLSVLKVGKVYEWH